MCSGDSVDSTASVKVSREEMFDVAEKSALVVEMDEVKEPGVCLCHTQREKRNKRIGEIGAEAEPPKVDMQCDPGLGFLKSDELLSIEGGAVVSMPCEDLRFKNFSTRFSAKKKRKADGKCIEDYTVAETNQHMRDSFKEEYKEFETKAKERGKTEEEAKTEAKKETCKLSTVGCV